MRSCRRRIGEVLGRAHNPRRRSATNTYVLQLIQDETSQTYFQTVDPKSLLASFPYHQNYIDLSNLEMATLSAYLSNNLSPKNIAFIGSGPLPLTSLCILDRYPSSTVHNIDRDATALAVSQTLCQKLGYDRMTFSREDITAQESSTRWVDFDVVFLAALVGCDTASKISILKSLAQKLKVGTLVVARSAKGLREVLYPVSPTFYNNEAWDMLTDVTGPGTFE